METILEWLGENKDNTNFFLAKISDIAIYSRWITLQACAIDNTRVYVLIELVNEKEWEAIIVSNNVIDAYLFDKAETVISFLEVGAKYELAYSDWNEQSKFLVVLSESHFAEELFLNNRD